MLREFRKLLRPNSVVPGARHALPRRTLARASVISVVLSSLLLVPLAPANAAACAPTSSTVGADTVLSFTQVGTCDWTVPTGVSSASVLVVGGGGGGSGNYTGSLASSSGSGGGGGVLSLTGLALPSSVSITVGAGGAGGTSSSNRSGAVGSQGGDSLFGSISAGGGGAGGCDSAATAGEACSSGSIHGRNGTAAGSGGSPSNFFNAYNFGSPGVASNATFNGQTINAVSGFRGGFYNDGGTSSSGSSGSGGGAGGAGNYNTPGSGVSSSITGSTYGLGGKSYGATGFSNAPSAPNSGNGGNGAYADSATSGAAGGSGIVVVRFSTPVPAAVQNFNASTRLVDADTDADSVTLTWDALMGQTPAVTGYVIESKKAGTDTWATAATVGAVTTATVGSLDDGATYSFRIAAVNSIGTGPTSTAVDSKPVSNVDYAFEFDGASDYLESGSTVIYSTAFTLEAWVNYGGSGTDTFRYIVNQRALRTIGFT